METKLYKQLAGSIQARDNCIKSNNHEWRVKHTEVIEKMLDMLPHGSGLDYQWDIDYAKSHANKIVLYSTYHAMDENGFYDGWLDFTLIIMPSLQFDFDLHIRGNFGKYQDIKDYLYEIIRDSLQQTIDTSKI